MGLPVKVYRFIPQAKYRFGCKKGEDGKEASRITVEAADYPAGMRPFPPL